jgi:hAT family protein
MTSHLDNECIPYKKKRAAEEKAQGRQTLLTQAIKPEASIAIDRLTAEQTSHLNKLAGYAVFCGARPFSLFEESAMLDFHAALKPSFKIPSSKTIGGRILDECYSETFLEVLQAIHTSFSINISTDESSTSSKDRVINYCIVTDKKESFCMKLELVEVGTSSAERQAAWLDESLDELETGLQEVYGPGAKLPFINSVATDTCSTMRSFWTKLGVKPRYKLTFFVPCDSHGLQLLIKDILEFPVFSTTMTECNGIVAHFSSSHKQLALLRSYMVAELGKTYALILAVPTRWGTQYNELLSIKRSTLALKKFGKDKKNGCTNTKVLKTLTDSSFWDSVLDLLDLLKPIHDVQVMSESSRGHVGHVRSQWMKIRDHLSQHEFASGLLDRFDARYNLQTSDLHLIAFFLDPKNLEESFGASDSLNRILEYFERYGGILDAKSIFRKELLMFRKRRELFSRADLWEKELCSNPVLFWELAEAYGSKLATFALRVLNTPSNSVPSERSFSAMKLQHSRLRTSLSLTKIHKLCFIHVNRRVLNNSKWKYPKKLYELSEEEELMLENTLLEMEISTALQPQPDMVEDSGDSENPSKRSRMN